MRPGLGLLGLRRIISEFTGKTSGKITCLNLCVSSSIITEVNSLEHKTYRQSDRQLNRQNVRALVPGPPTQTAKLRLEVANVLRAVAIEGEIARGEVFRLIGMSERSGRDTLVSLLEEGLLVSDSPRSPVRLGFPTHAAGYWFPELFPLEKT